MKGLLSNIYSINNLGCILGMLIVSCRCSNYVWSGIKVRWCDIISLPCDSIATVEWTVQTAYFSPSPLTGF